MAWIILALIAGAYVGAFLFACVVAWHDTHPTRRPRRRRAPAPPLDFGPITKTQ